MILTYSRVAAWKQCPRRYFFEYVEGLEPLAEPYSWWFGSLVHHLLQTTFHSRTNLREQAERFSQEHPHPKADNLSLAIACAMVEGLYESRALEKLGHTIVDQEVEIEVKLKDDLKFAGVIDLISKDRAGNLWIWEHKTASSFADADWLRLEDQSLYYLWALEETRGKAPLGVVYNMLRKPSIKPRNGESEEEYIARLGKDIARRPSFYFRQELIHKDPRQIREAKGELLALAGIIGKPPFYRNPHNCKHSGCVYREVCLMDSPVTRALYKKKN